MDLSPVNGRGNGGHDEDGGQKRVRGVGAKIAVHGLGNRVGPVHFTRHYLEPAVHGSPWKCVGFHVDCARHGWRVAGSRGTKPPRIPHWTDRYFRGRHFNGNRRAEYRRDAESGRADP